MPPQRTRPLAAEPRQRPSLSVLTELEINQCLKRAFDALPKEEQERINKVIKPLLDIRNVGFASALRVLFVATQGAKLDRLDAEVLNVPIIPQRASSETFSDHHLGGDGETVAADCARRN